LPIVKKLLPPFAYLANPLDLTWAGLYDPAVAQGCAEAIASQSNVGMLVLLQDAPTGLGLQQATRYSRLLEAVAKGAASADIPLVALSNVSDQPHPALQQVADQAKIPYLRGTRVGLSAISHYVKWSTRPAAPPVIASPAKEWKLARSGLDEIPSHRLAAEHEARDILRSYGVAGPREKFSASVEEAVAAAVEIGFPVVLKGLVENMVHKSDAGLVKVGLVSAAEVRLAAEAMLRSAAALTDKFLGFLVQQKVASLGEIFVGARVDPDFGPLIVVGAGGVQVELYKDVAIRLAPVSEQTAMEAIASTKIMRLLNGFRGRPPGDIQAVARTMSAVSRFIAEFSDRISEIEINPLAVMENGQGCVALDCVLIPKKP
jgi:acyl-CoA synthetase (NDP forming)